MKLAHGTIKTCQSASASTCLLHYRAQPSPPVSAGSYVPCIWISCMTLEVAPISSPSSVKLLWNYLNPPVGYKNSHHHTRLGVREHITPITSTSSHHILSTRSFDKCSTTARAIRPCNPPWLFSSSSSSANCCSISCWHSCHYSHPRQYILSSYDAALNSTKTANPWSRWWEEGLTMYSVPGNNRH